MDPGQPRVSHRRARVLGAGLQGAVLLGFAAVLGLVQQAPREPERRALEERALTLARSLELATVRALEALVPIRRELLAVDPPDWREFGHLVRAQPLPEGTVVLWAPQVAGRDLADFEMVSGRNAHRSFRIVERDGHGGIRKPQARAQHFPIELLDPLPEADRLLGLDLAGEPALRQALARAAETGAPQVAAHWQAARAAEHLVVVAPVLRGDGSTHAPRRAVGVLVAVLPLPASARAAAAPGPWTFELAPLPVARAVPLPLPPPGVLSVTAPFYVGERAWSVELSVPSAAARLSTRLRGR